jgi:tetratricopeptide (TPR) repeat protein
VTWWRGDAVTWWVVLASAGLAAIAAAGVLRPFGRARSVRLDRLADPLEDERSSLLRTLGDLEEERSAGVLSEQDYRTLRHETEVRAVSVLRALEAKGSVADSAEPFGERPEASPNGHEPAPRPRSRLLPAVIVAAIVVGIAVPLLAKAVGSRAPQQAITGDSNLGGGQGSSLAFFKKRVRDHPNDAAARLDLAERYVNAGLTGLAVAQFTAAIELDPQDVEANTGLALVLYGQGRAADGLVTVNRALAVDPTYPEALYAKGLILLDGLHHPRAAAVALRAYMAAAPFGAHRTQVEQLLASISPSS